MRPRTDLQRVRNRPLRKAPVVGLGSGRFCQLTYRSTARCGVLSVNKLKGNIKREKRRKGGKKDRHAGRENHFSPQTALFRTESIPWRVGLGELGCLLRCRWTAMRAITTLACARSMTRSTASQRLRSTSPRRTTLALKLLRTLALIQREDRAPFEKRAAICNPVQRQGSDHSNESLHFLSVGLQHDQCNMDISCSKNVITECKL